MGKREMKPKKLNAEDRLKERMIESFLVYFLFACIFSSTRPLPKNVCRQATKRRSFYSQIMNYPCICLKFWKRMTMNKIRFCAFKIGCNIYQISVMKTQIFWNFQTKFCSYVRLYFSVTFKSQQLTNETIFS